MTSSNSLLINANPSVDSAYLNSMDIPTENDLELQLDYWRMERIAANTIYNNENCNSDEYLSTTYLKEPMLSKSKIKERSITGNFWNITIYRKPVSYGSQNTRSNKNFDKFLGKNFQTSINCAKSQGGNANKFTQGFLSLDYVLLEKKQKSKKNIMIFQKKIKLNYI